MSEDQNRDLDAQFRDLVADMETDLDAGGVPEEAAARTQPLMILTLPLMSLFTLKGESSPSP